MSDAAPAGGLPAPGGPALPPSLARARAVLHQVGRAEMGLACLGLAAVVLISGAQAFMRYANIGSLWWAQEVAQLTIIMTYFFGVSYVFKARQYLLIEFLSVKAPLRVQLVMYMVAQVLTILFAGTVFWLFTRFAPTLYAIYTPTLGLPEILRSIPLAIASVMLVLTSLYYLAVALWAWNAGRGAADLYEIESWAMVSTMPVDIEEELII